MTTAATKCLQRKDDLHEKEYLHRCYGYWIRRGSFGRSTSMRSHDFSYPDDMDCIFCKIIAGTIPSKKVYEDDLTYAFADIDPKAPVHLLIVPKKHIPSLAAIDAADTAIVGHLHAIANRLAVEHTLSKGYRTVINTGADGGQTVDHLHVHLLGGRQMHWPPG